MVAVTGTLTSATGSSVFTPEYNSIQFNVTVSGTFVATLRLERSFDGGSTWHPYTTIGTAVTWTAPFSELWEEYESNVQYRLNCTSYTSGTITYRFSRD